MYKKVMLVDDDASIRRVGQICLSNVGKFDVVLAKSGAEALSMIEEETPDLILLDVMMPGMDGPSTLARLKESEATRHIPVIFMTAKVLRQEVESYHGMGAAGVIIKPFDPMTLPSDVLQLVDRFEQGSCRKEKLAV